MNFELTFRVLDVEYVHRHAGMFCCVELNSYEILSCSAVPNFFHSCLEDLANFTCCVAING